MLSRKETITMLAKFTKIRFVVVLFEIYINFRHEVNLRSDMLSPDIYWDRSDLDTLYTDVIRHFTVRARVNALNEQLSYCEHTLQMLGDLLSNQHSYRLEWIIIILIVMEVVLELAHGWNDGWWDKFVKLREKEK